MVLILKSTSSGLTPNKLAASDLVNPVVASQIANPASNINAVAVPAPVDTKNSDIFGAYFLIILLAPDFNLVTSGFTTSSILVSILLSPNLLATN